MSETEKPIAASSAQPIVFGQRFAGSETFKALFREGMTLVEDTAAYLDGPGRGESKLLPRNAGLTYATESMRLTTRLMQLASWLLLQRAVNEGEMSEEKARAENSKVRLKGFETNPQGPNFASLPLPLQNLVLRSIRLQERIQRLDMALYRGEMLEQAENPVERQIGQLRQALGLARAD